MKLTIDNDKIGYIRLPNGVILQTVAGVINTIYTGVAGGITYYVPKNTSSVDISLSSVTGNLAYTGIAGLYAFVIGSTSWNLPNTTTFDVGQGANLTDVSAPNAISARINNCALTAKSIGDILYAAYVANRANVNFDFTGGTSANATAINAYLTSTYGVGITLVAVKAALAGLGGTITNNP